MTISNHSTLTDVCFAVSEALAARGISAVLTGGSAATVYAPDVYTSYDADFITDESLADIAEALALIGFQRHGKSRLFIHPDTKYTIDFPKGPLAVAGDYITETATLTRGSVHLRILSRTDCIRDRLSHFFHWNDFTALNAAVGVATNNPADVEMPLLRAWAEREQELEKFAEFQLRVEDARQG